MGSREVWSRISRPRNAGGTPALGWAAGVRPSSGDERGRRYAIPGRWGYVIIEGTRGGSSSIGRAPDCGSGRCGFNSRLPPHFATACGWSQPRFTPSLQSGLASGLRKLPRLRCEIAPSTACAVLAGAPPSGYFWVDLGTVGVAGDAWFSGEPRGACCPLCFFTPSANGSRMSPGNAWKRRRAADNTLLSRWGEGVTFVITI